MYIWIHIKNIKLYTHLCLVGPNTQKKRKLAQILQGNMISCEQQKTKESTTKATNMMQLRTVKDIKWYKVVCNPLQLRCIRAQSKALNYHASVGGISTYFLPSPSFRLILLIQRTTYIELLDTVLNHN